MQRWNEETPEDPRRVLLIAYHFPPSADVGAQACFQITRHLPRYGWEPVVLTVAERFIESKETGEDRVFPGRMVRTSFIPHPLSVYRRLKPCPGSEVGTGTTAPPREASARRGHARAWLLPLLGLPDLYTGWIIPAVLAGFRAVRRLKIERLLSSAPYWTNHLVGHGLARLTGLPWTAHFRDPWMQARPVEPHPKLATRLELRLERMVMERATRVVCVTEPHTALLQSLYRELPPHKFLTIPNGYDGSEWEAAEAQLATASPRHERTFVITYAGSFSMLRTPLPVFRAVRRLLDEETARPGQVRIDLIGDCRTANGKSVQGLAAEYGLGTCLNLPGRLGRAETLQRILQSDLLLVLAEGWTIQIPAKTYEYLRARKPILALTERGALADFIRQSGGGWVVDPADDAGVAAAVRDAFTAWSQGMPGRSPRPELVAAFDRRLLAGRFAEVLEQAARS